MNYDKTVRNSHFFTSTATQVVGDLKSNGDSSAYDRSFKVYSAASPKAPLGGLRKRVFDLVFSVMALGAVSVIFLVVALCVRLSSPGPVFFRHDRIGYDGKIFKCLKFRTMHVDAEAQLAKHLSENEDAREEFETYSKLRNDPRIIPIVGNFLRKSSLDELPQLINVILGQMSLVGPRPVIQSELDRYGEARREYVSARPGITGLWQVSGRNNLDFAQRVAIDKHYARSWTFLRDISIMVRTVKVLINREGAC